MAGSSQTVTTDLAKDSGVLLLAKRRRPPENCRRADHGDVFGYESIKALRNEPKVATRAAILEDGINLSTRLLAFVSEA